MLTRRERQRLWHGGRDNRTIRSARPLSFASDALKRLSCFRGPKPRAGTGLQTKGCREEEIIGRKHIIPGMIDGCFFFPTFCTPFTQLAASFGS